MSKTVDQRIVDMQFNNGQFESGIKQSTRSLENLKKGLDLNKSAASLSNLGDTAKRFSLGGIADGVGTIANRFSALGIMGVTALANIANQAVNTGKRMLSALTIDPILSGFAQYELKMNTITTILTNTAKEGTNLQTVNNALKDLADYAALTIYDFSDMTRNIGTFTAAGVKLQPAVDAIKGLGNLAAGMGSTPQQAATAMYQLSQAMSAGRVTLMDWNSVVNAGMGGPYFQDALKATAKELGINTGKAKSFRDSLQSGWLTTEVLTKTLDKFAKDPALLKAATQVKTWSQFWTTATESVQQSWSQTWEYIIGGKEEAAKFFTDLANGFGNIVGPANNARNEMFAFWHDNGGRDALIQGLTNLAKGLGTVIKPIKDAFGEVFPPMTAQRLVEITKKFADLTAKFKMGDETASKVKDAFKGLFSFVRMVGQAFAAVGREVKKFLQWIAPVIPKILDLASSIGSWLTKSSDAAKQGDVFNKTFEKLNTVLGSVGVKAKAGLDKVRTAFENFSGLDLSSFSTFVDGLKVKLATLEKIGAFLTKVGTAFGNFFKKVAPYFSKIGTFFGNLLGNMNLNTLLAMFSTGTVAAILVGLQQLISSFKDISKGAGGFLKGIQDILDGVKSCLEAWQKDIQANTLLKIAASILILAVALLLLASINANKLTSSLTAITTLFGELFGSMAIFSKLVQSSGFKDMGTVTWALLGLSASVLLLSWAMAGLAKLDWGGITKGLVSVGVLVGMLVASAKLMSMASGDMLKVGAGLLLLSVAIGGLALSLVVLSLLDPQKLATGLLAVSLLLAELALFTKVMGDGKGLIGTSIGLMGLAVAMLLLSTAVLALGSMQPQVLGSGLMALSLALAAVTLALQLMPPNMAAIGLGMLLVSAGLLLIAQAISMMGSMSWEGIGKGLATLAASLLILVVAMQFMTSALPGALSLLIIAGSLIVLAIALQMMGNLSWEQLGKGLLAIVAILLIFAGAALLLGPVIPVIAALGIALLAMGVGLISVGLAALMLSIGLSALAVTGTAGIDTLTAVAKALAPYILLGPGLLLLGAALLVVSVGTIGLGLALGVLASGLGLLTALGPMGIMSLMMLANMGKQIGELAGWLMLAGAALLVFGAGCLVAGVGALLGGIGVAVLGAGLMVLEQVDFTKLAGIGDIAGELLKAGGVLLLAAPGLAAGGAALIAFGAGAANTGDALASIQSGLTNCVGTLKNVPNDVKGAGDAIVTAVNGVIDRVNAAVAGQSPKIVSTSRDLIDQSTKAIDSKRYSFFTCGTNLVEGFVQGMHSKISSAASEAAYMATSALEAAKRALDSHSPSRKAKDLGMNFDFGFGDGLLEYAHVAQKAAYSVGESTLRPVQDMTNTFASGADVMGRGIQSMANKALAIDPTINAQKTVTVKHEFDPLQVQGVNDKKQLVAVANYSVEDILMTTMRRQARVMG